MFHVAIRDLLQTMDKEVNDPKQNERNNQNKDEARQLILNEVDEVVVPAMLDSRQVLSVRGNRVPQQRSQQIDSPSLLPGPGCDNNLSGAECYDHDAILEGCHQAPDC